MKNPTHSPSSRNEEPEPTCYASFILRCWLGDREQMRARLVDVNSGVSYPVSHLNQLPRLLGQLLRRALFQPPACDTPYPERIQKQYMAPSPTEPDRSPAENHVEEKGENECKK